LAIAGIEAGDDPTSHRPTNRSAISMADLSAAGGRGRRFGGHHEGDNKLANPNRLRTTSLPAHNDLHQSRYEARL
jgi:hypothetical protein